MACAEQHGLNGCVEVGPPVSYHRAIAEMMGSDLLLVFQGSNFNTQIPAKIYEYLRAGRAVLAVVDPMGGTAGQLAQFEGAQIADIASPDDIRTALLATLRARSESDHAAAMARNRSAVQIYSRQAQAVRLKALFDSVAFDDMVRS